MQLLDHRQRQAALAVEAITGKARALVSGDKDLLALAGAPGLCPVMSIDAFCRQVLAA